MNRIIVIILVQSLLIGGFYRDGLANTPTQPSLKIALIHFSVEYKKPEQNLAALTELHRKAARQGAKIIFNTELALSGYSFSSREDVAPFTQTETGKAVRTMSQLAKELKVYIGITFPEKDPTTQSYYNTAVVLSPEGEKICKYRKVYGEKRWARPGNPKQDGTFDTPWGRVGVTICADSYFGLIPRTMALKGVDILWVPANWPSMGKLSPLDVWQARTMENGFYLAACNRTGKDRVMDCSKAVSAVIAPDGTPLVKKSSNESELLLADIPLDKTGRIDNRLRKKQMEARDIELYRQIYLDPWTENLTQYYQLPEPGNLKVRCFMPGSGEMKIQAIEKLIKKEKTSEPCLWVLPRSRAGALDEKELVRIARIHHGAFALNFSKNFKEHEPVLITEKGVQSFIENKISAPFPFRRLQFGPAAIAMVPMAALRHPELGIVLAKLGIDLVLVSEADLSVSDVCIGTIRTVDGLAIAASACNTAFIAHMKGVHGDLKIVKAIKKGFCSFLLDTGLTRKKQFYDRIDFDVLLKDKSGDI